MSQNTLLYVVQSTLRAINGDVVNSIDDTQESQDVAAIAKDVFDFILDEVSDWKFTQKVRQLESVSDNTKPNYLKIPDNLHRIEQTSIKYNSVNVGESGVVRYKPVIYCEPLAFMDRISQNRSTTNNTQIVTGFNNVQMVIFNNADPSFCTSIDDEYLIFDSYNSAVDTTLQASKSQIISTESRAFTISDSYVIDLPDDMQSMYLSGVKAWASEYLREEALPRDARLFDRKLARERVRSDTIGQRDRRRLDYRNIRRTISGS